MAARMTALSPGQSPPPDQHPYSFACGQSWQLQKPRASSSQRAAHRRDEVVGGLRERRVAVPGEADLPGGHAARGVQRDDAGDARVDREPRDQRRADARRDHPLHRSALVAAEHDVRLDPARPQQRLDAVGAAAVGDQGQPADLGQRRRTLALRERRARLRQEHIGIPDQLDVLEGALGRHEREREVEAPALDHRQQLVLVGRLLQAHLDAGAELHEAPHGVRQDADRHALERPDAQGRRSALGECREIGLGRLELRGQARGVAEHALARIRRHDRPPAAGALEQTRSGRALERGDLQAHGRLGVAEPPAGLRERPRRRHGVERDEVPDLDAEHAMRFLHHYGR